MGWRTTVPRIYEAQLKRCVNAAGKVDCDELLKGKKPAAKLKKRSRQLLEVIAMTQFGLSLKLTCEHLKLYFPVFLTRIEQEIMILSKRIFVIRN